MCEKIVECQQLDTFMLKLRPRYSFILVFLNHLSTPSMVSVDCPYINWIMNPHFLAVIPRIRNWIIVLCISPKRSRPDILLKTYCKIFCSNTYELDRVVCIFNPIDGSRLLPLRTTHTVPLLYTGPQQFLLNRGGLSCIVFLFICWRMCWSFRCEMLLLW